MKWSSLWHSSCLMQVRRMYLLHYFSVLRKFRKVIRWVSTCFLTLMTTDVQELWGFLCIYFSLPRKCDMTLISPKLNAACYALRKLNQTMSQQTLTMVYYAYFCSIMSYGMIFWGTSQYSTNLFKIWKKTIRIITNSGSRESCRPLFNKLQILTFNSQHFLITFFVHKNKE